MSCVCTLHACTILVIIECCVHFVGFNCEAHENPADFFLDTINECEKEVNGVTETSKYYTS